MLVEARVENGLLLTAALPPLAARGPAITIRRPRREAVRLADLVGQAHLFGPNKPRKSSAKRFEARFLTLPL